MLCREYDISDIVVDKLVDTLEGIWLERSQNTKI